MSFMFGVGVNVLLSPTKTSCVGVDVMCYLINVLYWVISVTEGDHLTYVLIFG